MSGEFANYMSAQHWGSEQRKSRAVSVGHIAKTAVALLRGDVGLVQSGSSAALAAANAADISVTAHQLANPVIAFEQGYHGQISVPLWRNGRRVGTLAVLSRKAREFGDAEVALLRELADTIEVSEGRVSALVH